MLTVGCAGCRHTGRCGTCLGAGKRIRIRGVLLKKQEVVRCRVCLGSGDCRLCGGVCTWGPVEAAEPQPREDVIIPYRRPR